MKFQHRQLAVLGFIMLGGSLGAGCGAVERAPVLPTRGQQPETIEVLSNPESASLNASAQLEAIVLVPGTVNSGVPGSIRFDPVRGELELNPYFSRDVIEPLEQQGYPVHVVRNLQWFGSFEDNGEIVRNDVRAWMASAHLENARITFVTHSAGALYALQALTLDPLLPVKRIIMISAPLQGEELADRGFDIKALQALWDVTFGPVSDILELRGIPQLTSIAVKKFLSQVHIPADVELYSIAGSQSRMPDLLHLGEPWYFSPVFALTSTWIGRDSDGLVSSFSAWGSGAEIKDAAGHALAIHPLYDKWMPLDHVEQFLDYRLFAILGTRHAEWIRDNQRAFYGSILQAAHP